MSFSPPSDFVEDSSGGAPWGKIIVFGSAGCLVAIAVVALLMTWGTCTVTQGCCDAIEEANRRLLAPAQAFVTALGEGDIDGAYQQTTEGFRERNTKEAFTQRIEAEGDLFKGGEVKFVKVGRKHGTDLDTLLTVQIVDVETRTAKGVVTFVYAPGDPDEYVIDDIIIGTADTEFARTDISRVVDLHVKAIARGELDWAWTLHHPQYQEEVPLEALAAQLEPYPLQSAVPLPYEIGVDGLQAQVNVAMSDPAGEPLGITLQYQLQQDNTGWRVTAFSISSSGSGGGLAIEPDADAGAVDAEADADPTEADTNVVDEEESPDGGAADDGGAAP